MKIKELEERINKRLIDEGLTDETKGIELKDLRYKIKNIVDSELFKLGKELSNTKEAVSFSSPFYGNAYNGIARNTLEAYVRLSYKGTFYSHNLSNPEFKCIIRKVKNGHRYYTDWYIKNIEVEFYSHDKDEELEDIIAEHMNGYIEEEKRQKRVAREKAKEKEKERLAEEKLKVERTKELLDYIHKNNLDTEEFKEMARKYISYCQGNV